MGNWLFDDKELVDRERLRQAGPQALPCTNSWFRRNGWNVYCYGGGGTLHIALHVLDGVNPVGVVDGNPALWGKTVLGYTIEPPESLLEDKENIFVVISVATAGATAAIAGWCEEHGIRSVGWDDVHNLSEPVKWRTNIEDIPEAKAVAGIWADDLSRATYMTLLKTRGSFAPAKYPPMVPDHYFQEFVPRRYYRNFVDLGAYRGDTLAAYLEWMNNDFDAYYAVEALPDNYAALRDSTSDKRVRCFNTAVGEFSGTARMRYESSSMPSAIFGDDGDIEVPVDTVDKLLAGCAVGMVKMDIEGAEPHALRGAAKTIQAQKPALAISVYHRLKHLWEIPAWIKNIEPAYQLFLRHHSEQVGETVCYAVASAREQSRGGIDFPACSCTL